VKSTNYSGSENVPSSSNSSGEIQSGEKRLFLSKIFDFITKKPKEKEEDL
jgi:hypothetical protein